MIININDYRKKVLGCWMGKNIGGTIGAPMEWKRQVNNVTFYTQDLNGDPLPNDDLDLQLVWLIALEEKGINIDARTLGEYWLSYITPHWSEYGNGKVNMKSGLMPPLSGIEANLHKDSCGAYIRSEIWACIAPGCPQIAAKYAYEDSIVDHGNGEGMYAEVFCAALESAAFVEKDIYKLINIGLSYIPQDCGVARAIKCSVECYKSGMSWVEARNEILEKYRGHYYEWAGISIEDKGRGFEEGQVGWDVPSNIGIVIIGLLYGEGDFEKSICITVNCGEDTDCTAATLGSIYGIINGIDSIPEKWIKPIGRGIKTICINLADIWISRIPANIDLLTERVERVARQVVLANPRSTQLSEIEVTDISDLKDSYLYSQCQGKDIYRSLNGPVYKSDFIDVMVEYVDGPYIKDGTTTKIAIRIQTKTQMGGLNIQLYAPENFQVTPARKGKLLNCSEAKLEFGISSDKVTDITNRFVLEITVDGRHTVMLIPIILINNNLS